MDCLYHGYTPGSNCPGCDANRAAGRPADDDGPVQVRPAGPTPPSFRRREGPLAVEKGREHALAQLDARKTENRGVRRPSNSDFYAGSPMYFYCGSCGDLSDVKPESYNPREDPIKCLCGECEALKEKGWLP
ncbi:MAG TPA: hypothetical protein VN495_02135 [Candidatus Paceibacterota bacterium]|nr:hypothetical protein [Candidatus Paceibacterota bacterium]